MSRLFSLSLARLVRALLSLLTLLALWLLALDLYAQSSLAPALLPADAWIPLLELPDYPLLALCMMLVALPLLVGLLNVVIARQERGIVGRGKDGEDITLASEAVSKAIIREVKTAVEEVMFVRSCVTLQGFRAPKVTIALAISDRAPVPAVQKRVKKVIVDTLEHLIGYADGRHVRVRIVEVNGASGPRPKRAVRRVRKPVPTVSPKTEEAVPLP